MSDSFIKLGEETFGLQDSIDSLTKFFSYYDSGLTPLIGSGVILHRYGYGSEQIVYQFEPQFRGVVYKQHEESEGNDVHLYNLPFPYVIIAIAYENNVFQGIRHYFSPTPITTLDQQLYMPSLPNTNCIGYNETSVGWVCLYHHPHANFTTLQQKLEYACERYDPISEPYNYGNMPSTDGYNFYKNFKRAKHTWHPATWEKYGKEHGLEWTLALDTWLPIRTEGNGCLAYHADGYPHNLREALYDVHYGYYRTRSAVLLNEYAQLDDKGKTQFISKHMRRGLIGGMAPVEPKPKKIHIKDWVNGLTFDTDKVKQILQFGIHQDCTKCGGSFTFQAYPAPNVLTAIQGLKSGQHKPHFGWYCINCVNNCCSTLSHVLCFYVSRVGENEWIHVANEMVKSQPVKDIAPIQYYDTVGARVLWHGRAGYITTDIGGGVATKGCKKCAALWLDTYPGFSDVYNPTTLEEVGCRQCVISSFDLEQYVYVHVPHKYMIDYQSILKFFNIDQSIQGQLNEYFKIHKQMEVYVPIESILKQIKKRFKIDIDPYKAITSTVLQGLFNHAYGSAGLSDEEYREQLLVFAETFHLLEEKETEGKKSTKPTKKAVAKKAAPKLAPNKYQLAEALIKKESYHNPGYITAENIQISDPGKYVINQEEFYKLIESVKKSPYAFKKEEEF